MSTPAAALPRRRPVLRKVGCGLALGLLAAVLALELLSRVADGVVARRAADPAWRPAEEPRGLWESLCRLTLEYGSVKRGLEQSRARSQPHPYLGYALVPGFRSPDGATQQVSHNALGFRGRETSWQKPPGTYRILTTGGSSVYGQSESSDAAVWSQVLEDRLRQRHPERALEVVNLGVPGWSSFEILINLELRGLELEPDLVIVYEAINDMRCALYKRGGPVTSDNLQWRQAWPVDRPSALEGMLAASRSYLVWRRYFTGYVARRADLGFYAITNYDPREPDLYWDYADGPAPEQGFENYRRNLELLVAACRARGARVLFATQALPRWHLEHADSRAEQLDAFERVLATQREVAARLGVPLCESGARVEAALEAEVRARIEAAVQAEPGRPRAQIEAEWRRPGRRDLLFFQEVHPNDAGSALVADAVAECVEELLAR
jgi:lysophospholipase L1-like esterase